MTEIVIYLQHGRPVLSDGSGGKTGGLVYEERTPGKRSQDWPRKVASWAGVGNPRSVERAEFVASVIRRLEAKFGVDAWYYDGYRVTSLKPKPSSKPKPCWTLCQITIHGEGYGSSHPCNRPVPEGETRCGIHRAAAKRRAANDAERKAEYAKRQQARDRDKARTEDLRALWAECCDLYGVEPERAGRVWIDGTTAHVDDEVLIRFLRTLIERSD